MIQNKVRLGFRSTNFSIEILFLVNWQILSIIVSVTIFNIFNVLLQNCCYNYNDKN